MSFSRLKLSSIGDSRVQAQEQYEPRSEEDVVEAPEEAKFDRQ